VNQADYDNTESVHGERIPAVGPLPGGREAILKSVVAAVSGMIRDSERDVAAPIAGNTRLVADLGYQSLDIVVLTADMSRQLHRRDLPFERLLLVDGRPVSDLSLDQLADFLWEQISNIPVIEAP
jgi:acyl carrier protein